MFFLHVLLFQVYFAITIVTMGHFIDVEQRYLSGAMVEPESESFLEPEKITPSESPTLHQKYYFRFLKVI